MLNRVFHLGKLLVWGGARKALFVFTVWGQLLLAENNQKALPYSPPNGSILNYTQVLFEWVQVPQAVAYQIEITQFESQIEQALGSGVKVVDAVDSTLAYISTNVLKWAKYYSWRIRGLTAKGVSLGWGSERFFRIIDLPINLFGINVIRARPEEYNPGITAFDLSSTTPASAINEFGEFVWVVYSTMGDGIKSRFQEILPNGNFIAQSSKTVYELTIDNRLVWAGSDLDRKPGIHHDLITMPGGHYMALTSDLKRHAIPAGPWQAFIDSDSMAWRGDRLIEWDEQGEVIWSWSVFDHFNFLDYDSVAMTISFGPGLGPLVHDWTHMNSIFFDSTESAIYLSSRHLSRVTKLDYPSGEVIWNMGREMPSGEVDFGANLDFSYQHAVKVLDNGNLMMFDNGNLRAEKYSRSLEIAVTDTGDGWEASIIWEYILPTDKYSEFAGDSDRLGNGNTLITATTKGYMVEVNSDKEVVWELTSGMFFLPFRAERIPNIYPHAFSVVYDSLLEISDTEDSVGTDSHLQLNFVVYNEGWLDASYKYSLTDQAGFSIDTGVLSVQHGRRTIVNIAIPVAGGEIFDTLFLDVSNDLPNGTTKAMAIPLHMRDSAGNPASGLPSRTSLGIIYPNPFNNQTMITYRLREASALTVIIYDIMGREISTLVDRRQPAGTYWIPWNAGLNASGLYLVGFKAGDVQNTAKILLVK